MTAPTAVDRLSHSWRTPRGWATLTAVDHKSVGLRWIVTAFIFFMLAGLLALVMVAQLSGAGMGVLSAEAYNQFFTMHGSTMMFFFAVPVMLGVGIYFVPLMIGARDVPFPRLNAFGYYVYLFSGLLFWTGLLIGAAPDQGWFSYVPLAGPEYSPRVNVDFYAIGISFLEIANLVAAVVLIVTIFKGRAPGMSINRMPLFVWSMLVVAWMIVFAMPPLMLATLMLYMDRTIGTFFFRVGGGGEPFLWQHLFWWFGHPEVYIIAIPAFGMVSMLIPPFVGRRIVGYLPIVLATVAIGIVSFGLWVHHMFAGSLSLLGMSFFAAASMAIAIPSGVQVFAWIATIWAGTKVVWRTPLLWVIGFIFTFVIGGITGVMVASPPFDWQVHDSHFVTAHFHYVLLGGSVFPLIGALYYWFPKVSGRLMDEGLGRFSFALVFVGFNVAFFTMHYTGFQGMPRRVHTYIETQGWDGPMLLTFGGAIILGIGFLVTLVNVIASLRGGALAGDDPWGAHTLEWATTSPPTEYNYRAIPRIRSRVPMWDQVRDEDEHRVVYQLGGDGRETISTSVLDAEPEQRLRLAGPSIWPLALALAVTFTFAGAMIDLILVPIGGLLSFIAIVGWNWPGNNRPREYEP